VTQTLLSNLVSTPPVITAVLCAAAAATGPGDTTIGVQSRVFGAALILFRHPTPFHLFIYSYICKQMSKTLKEA